MLSASTLIRRACLKCDLDCFKKKWKTSVSNYILLFVCPWKSTLKYPHLSLSPPWNETFDTMSAKQSLMTVSAWFSKADAGTKLHANSGTRSRVMLRVEGSVTFLPPIRATFTPNVVGVIISQIYTWTTKRSFHGLVYNRSIKINWSLIVCAKQPAKQSHRCLGCDDKISFGMYAHLQNHLSRL